LPVDRIVLEITEGGLPGDPVALRRVFMNLLHNAVKYNQSGGSM